ncbi:MAG: winged helix DNA-binding protein [Clostridium sp.]|nr:winged helix DNA-binding protein [Clostridium sp.]
MTRKKECECPEACSKQEEISRVGFQLKVLDHLCRRNLEASIRESGFEGMSVINAWIIDYLACNEGKSIFQKDIEKQFKIGKSSIAGTLKMMEEKGVIVRQSMETDARLKRVSLTEKGKEYARRMKQGRDDMEQKICKGLTKEELELFFHVVKKMQDNLLE